LQCPSPFRGYKNRHFYKYGKKDEKLFSVLDGSQTISRGVDMSLSDSDIVSP